MPETLNILETLSVAGVVDPGLPASATPATAPELHTVFGLTLPQLHARFWAARGVQVIRPGDQGGTEIVRHAELYLLLPPGKLALFPLAELMDTLNWVHPHLLLLRLHDPRKQRYREEVLADDSNRFVAFRRIYGSAAPQRSSPLRAALTPRPDLAKLWQQSANLPAANLLHPNLREEKNGDASSFTEEKNGDASSLMETSCVPVSLPGADLRKAGYPSARRSANGWRILRRSGGRAYASVHGMFYDPADAAEAGQFTQDLLRAWPTPATTIARAAPLPFSAGEKNGDTSSFLKTSCDPVSLRGRLRGGWGDVSAKVAADAQIVGPVWVGAGRTIAAGQTIIGPAIVWDDPAARPAVEGIAWQTIEPGALAAAGPGRGLGVLGQIDRVLQRGFDIVFSLIAIALTLPLYPLILAAIWVEDGRPFFFAHRRESRGGKPFGCIKFRSMRKNAEALKARLAGANRADGPQFFIPDDPRLTRVGRFLRKTNLDELPQFFNVLLGQMAIVGPRPSPHAENQFCPAWREARLSVRPGITGLWQVCRTRRQGADFQEWIRYDIEYVERRSLWLDLEILLRTVAMLIGFTH